MFKTVISASILLLMSVVTMGTVKALPTHKSEGLHEVQQSTTCDGIVKDQTGETIIGASVQVKGTKTGTMTNADGAFSLKGVNQGDVIHISFIGYLPQEVKWEGKPLDIILKEDTQVLDEIVVTALGIKREQKALSYNVQQVKADELLGVKDANFMNALVGKVAGVNINSAATGIGGATRVVMRGAKSITKDNNALYVIDGVPIFNNNGGGLEQNNQYADQPSGEGISDLNPEDIESMSVLTGPAAAALYGSNAANGAILITTKKGLEGRPKVTVSHQTTYAKPFVLPKFQNKYGNTPDNFTSWGAVQDKYDYEPSDFFRTGSTHQTSASLSVGSKQSQTYASLGATTGDGIVVNNDYSKYNITLRNTTKFLKDKMTLDFGFSYIKQKEKNMLSSGEYYNPLTAVYLFPRGEDFNAIKDYMYYDKELALNQPNWVWGNQGLDMQNPYWVQNRNIRTNKKDRYMANVNLSYNILEWLNVAGRARLDNSDNLGQMKLYAGTIPNHAAPEGSYKYSNTTNRQTYADFLLNINKYIDVFSVNTNIGTSVSDVRIRERGAESGLMIPNFFAVTNLDRNYGSRKYIHTGWTQQTQSVFANFELGWRSMIYLTLTGRNDWDSALAATQNTSFFYPSIGLSGVVTEMLSLPKAISYLQVRGSYSSVGSAIPRHLSVPSYSFNDQSGTWNTISYLKADVLKPERTGSWELGMSSKFLQGKLTFDVTWYKSNTKNQTFNPSVQTADGDSSMYLQTGNVQNMGWEMALGTNLSAGDFSWSGHVTASTNKNEIKEMVREGQFFDQTGKPIKFDDMGQGGVGSLELRLRPGGTMGDLYVKQKLKRDANGKLELSPEGAPVLTNDMNKVGSVLPKWNLGFRNDFRWKDVTLGFMISARFGGVVASGTQAIMDARGVSKDSQIARDNGGVTIDGVTFDAKKYYQATGEVGGLMSNYIYSADNIRLQELSVGYHLPKRWLNTIANIHVSFVGRNLWMIHNKAPFDPEATASTGTFYQGIDYFMQPSLRSLGFSVRADF